MLVYASTDMVFDGAVFAAVKKKVIFLDLHI